MRERFRQYRHIVYAIIQFHAFRRDRIPVRYPLLKIPTTLFASIDDAPPNASQRDVLPSRARSPASASQWSPLTAPTRRSPSVTSACRPVANWAAGRARSHTSWLPARGYRNLARENQVALPFSHFSHRTMRSVHRRLP